MKKVVCTFLPVFFLSCAPNNNAMEIRYTSVNDFYAHYVYNFRDDAAGIKQLYEYALNELKASRHYRDSVTASGHQYDARENLPLKAEPVVFYKTPEALQGQPDSSDMLINYYPDEQSYELTDMAVTGCNKQMIQEGDWTALANKDGKCILQLKRKELDLCALDGIMHKVKTLNYQTAAAAFTYSIVNENKKELLDIAYREHGKYLAMLFPDNQR